MVKDSYEKTVKVKVSNRPPKKTKKQNKTKRNKFYLSVINFLFVSFSQEKQKIAVSLFFWWFGGEKVALPPLFVLAFVALLATLTVHRVPCDSVAHDEELGSVGGVVG